MSGNKEEKTWTQQGGPTLPGQKPQRDREPAAEPPKPSDKK